MSKKYVIEEALLSCQYGTGICKLKPWDDRHIFVGDKLIASECDMGMQCCKEAFESCWSPYVASVKLETREHLSNLQQLAVLSDIPCEMSVRLQWQNSKDNVFLGGYKALMEDGWTICERGLGILSLVDSGQAEEVPAQEMQECLEKLDDIVDSYMAEHGISEKKKAGIMDSVLLWNGYLGQDMPWDYKSNETNREFCSYLEKEDPHLFNYFERGLYLQDGENGPIDLSYMIGINKALTGTKDEWECVSKTMTEDRGMYNGYLEACCRQDSEKSSYEFLSDFLEDYNNPDYNGQKRYTAYVAYPDEDTRDFYCSRNGYNQEEMTETEQNLGVLHNMIKGRIENNMPVNEEDRTSLSGIVNAQSKKAEEVTNAFLSTLKEDVEKGG